MVASGCTEGRLTLWFRHAPCLVNSFLLITLANSGRYTKAQNIIYLQNTTDYISTALHSLLLMRSSSRCVLVIDQKEKPARKLVSPSTLKFTSLFVYISIWSSIDEVMGSNHLMSEFASWISFQNLSATFCTTYRLASVIPLQICAKGIFKQRIWTNWTKLDYSVISGSC